MTTYDPRDMTTWPDVDFRVPGPDEKLAAGWQIRSDPSWPWTEVSLSIGQAQLDSWFYRVPLFRFVQLGEIYLEGDQYWNDSVHAWRPLVASLGLVKDGSGVERRRLSPVEAPKAAKSPTEGDKLMKFFFSSKERDLMKEHVQNAKNLCRKGTVVAFSARRQRFFILSGWDEKGLELENKHLQPHEYVLCAVETRWFEDMKHYWLDVSWKDGSRDRYKVPAGVEIEDFIVPND